MHGYGSPGQNLENPSKKAELDEEEYTLNIAYLTTKYPSVSHTFIRRELLEIQRRGHRVTRIALRPSDAPLVNSVDEQEAAETLYFFTQSAFRHFFALIRMMVFHPIGFFRGLGVSLRMSSSSERGLLKHLGYVLEACTFYMMLRKRNVDHIHVHFGTNIATVARVLKYFGGPSYSFTVHGPAEFDAPIGFDLSGKIADAAFVVSISDFCSAQLKRWSRLEDWSKIHTVHCSVGEDFFSATVPFDSKSRTFVCVGRLSAQKGQMVLIQAFAELLKSRPEAKLVFVGDGELRHEIEAMIDSYGIGESVTISGYVSEEMVRKYIAESRAMVLPSFAEGLPMVIMEAFAVGRPVISTYVAGIPELVKSGENGWLVPAGNQRELVRSMIEALDTSPGKMEKMARHGHQLTKMHHHTRTEGDVLERLFRSYLSG